MTATPTILGDRKDGVYVENVPVVLQALVTQTATSTSATYDLGSYGTLRADLHVSAASGTTPSMTVQLNTSPDGINWTALGSAFTAATAATDQHKVFAGCDRYLQAVATITGTTPSFTWSLTGSAV